MLIPPHSMDLAAHELDLFAQIVWQLQAPAGPREKRQRALADVVTLLRADCGASYVWNAALQKSTDCVASNIDRQQLHHYDALAHKNDLLTPLFRAQRRPTCTDHVLPRQALERSAFYGEFLRPCRMHHGINVFFFDGHTDLGDLRIWRAPGQPAFGQREQTLLSALTPFFQKALAAPSRPAGLLHRLSPKEQTVARYVMAGCSDKEIAQRLSIAQTTVRTHLKHAMEKTGAINRTDLAMQLCRDGLPPPS